MSRAFCMTPEEFLESAPLSPVNALTCSRCGSPTEVKDSRPTLYARMFTTMKRRRRCTSCEHSFNTYEVTQDELEKLYGLPVRISAVQRTLVQLLEQVNRLGE